MVRLAILASAAFPPGARNWSFHRSMFACTGPPCPCPKKYTTNSAVSLSPGAGGMRYVAARIGCVPSLFHPAGGVHLSPATDSAKRPAAAIAKINQILMTTSVLQIGDDRKVKHEIQEPLRLTFEEESASRLSRLSSRDDRFLWAR